jgi:hypothetical protein
VYRETKDGHNYYNHKPIMNMLLVPYEEFCKLKKEELGIDWHDE